MAALAERRRSGSGQSVEVSQWEATMVMSEEVLLDLSISGRETGAVGFRHPLLCPHGSYACLAGADDDPTTAWISIAVGSDAEWQALVEVLRHDGLELPLDAPTWSLEHRHQYRGLIDSAIEGWTKTRDRYEATKVLQAAGIAAFAIQNIVDVFADPQLAWRESFVEVDHPLVGTEPMPGLAWRLLRTPGGVQGPAPLLGQHTRELLTGELGLKDADVDHLVETGVVEVKPEPAVPG